MNIKKGIYIGLTALIASTNLFARSGWVGQKIYLFETTSSMPEDFKISSKSVDEHFSVAVAYSGFPLRGKKIGILAVCDDSILTKTVYLY